LSAGSAVRRFTCPQLTLTLTLETSKPQVTNTARESGRKQLHVILFTFDLFRWYVKWSLRTTEPADTWEDTECWSSSMKAVRTTSFSWSWEDTKITRCSKT